MKKIILLILVLSLLWGCNPQDEKISVHEYGDMYQQLMTQLDLHLSKKILKNASYHLRKIYFDEFYTKADYVEAFNEYIELVEASLLEMAKTGPLIDNPELQTYHSKLEDALVSLSIHLKNHMTRDSVTRRQVSRKTAIAESYYFSQDTLSDYKKMNTYQLEIEKLLTNEGYVFDQSFVNQRLNTTMGFSVYRASLATINATFAEYSGVNVDIDEPNIYKPGDGKHYMFSERNLKVVVMCKRDLEDVLLWKKDFMLVHDLQKDPTQVIEDYLMDLMASLDQYCSYRVLIPDDFFRSYEFVNRQVFSHFIYDLELGKQKVYVFDESTEDLPLTELAKHYQALNILNEDIPLLKFINP